jgi:hypothetical protein
MPDDGDARYRLIAGCIRAGYTALVVAVVAQAPEAVQVLLAAPLPVLAWELRTLSPHP